MHHFCGAWHACFILEVVYYTFTWIFNVKRFSLVYTCPGSYYCIYVQFPTQLK
jgi:hypothetical protein